MDATKTVRCNACGCAFEPKALTETDEDIEFTFFRCDYCGKAYMVTVTDSQLRADIAEYERLAELNRQERLPEAEQFRIQAMKAANADKERELHSLYLREGSCDGE